MIIILSHACKSKVPNKYRKLFTSSNFSTDMFQGEAWIKKQFTNLF